MCFDAIIFIKCKDKTLILRKRSRLKENHRLNSFKSIAVRTCVIKIKIDNSYFKLYSMIYMKMHHINDSQDNDLPIFRSTHSFSQFASIRAVPTPSLIPGISYLDLSLLLQTFVFDCIFHSR